VVEFYSDRGDENDRLSASALGQLEFARTRELIQRFLPAPPAKVLDVGGGSGAYSTWLASLGYDVHLVEPVPLHVEQASVRASAGPRFLVSIGDAGALPVADGTQDVILMLGPLYHLPDPGDRARAWGESRRVLKPMGVVIAVAITISTRASWTACGTSSWTGGSAGLATFINRASWPRRRRRLDSRSRACLALKDPAVSSLPWMPGGQMMQSDRQFSTRRGWSRRNRASSARATTR